MTTTKTKPVETKVTITIIDNRMFANTQRLLLIILGFVLPITLGVVLQSQAMQWFGFLFGVITMMGVVKDFTDKYRVHSVEDARTLLDKIEREQL